MLEIAKIIDRKLQYPCIHNFTSYQREEWRPDPMTFQANSYCSAAQYIYLLYRHYSSLLQSAAVCRRRPKVCWCMFIVESNLSCCRRSTTCQCIIAIRGNEGKFNPGPESKIELRCILLIRIDAESRSRSIYIQAGVYTFTSWSACPQLCCHWVLAT